MHTLRSRKLRPTNLLVWSLVALCACLGRVDRGLADPEKPAKGASAPHRRVANPFPHRVKVPDDLFDGGHGWLNVSGPIELKDLRGKIVVIDFWTYCCINCMHILPDLKYLEHKYPRELVVIGVHSAKFANEKESENIRRAIVRYEIEHPVLNDSDLTVWSRGGVNVWPTLALIDPEGKLVKAVTGEGHRAALDADIAKLVAYHEGNGTLDRAPLALGLERHKLAATPLKFPGKVLADEAGGRLFIADSNHNRIVIASLDGKLLNVVGSGAVGEKNGPFASATFHHPQGMALAGDKLYVADTENHLIRVLDLKHKKVTTLAGTGKQSPGQGAGGLLRETALNSPWDLLIVGRTLYVAMAGSQQIWVHALGSDSIRVLAGTGREDVLDGPPEEAAFAQPSGLASDGQFLFVADSEGSAIRRIPLDHSGSVGTVAGTSNLDNGQSLFAFGDADGKGSAARFQHPLGLAYASGRLYAADTYNHKIKVVDPSTGAAETLLGTGKRGDGLNPPEFAEPGGLSVAGGKLYIADTNNQVIKVAETSGRNVRVFEIEGLAPPKTHEQTPDEFASKETVKTSLPTVHLAAGDALRLEFSFHLPADCKLNKEAPITCRLRAAEPTALLAASQLSKRHAATLEADKAHVLIPAALKPGHAVLEVALSFTYCRGGVSGLCKLGSEHWTVPIDVAESGGESSIPLTADVKAN
jgi:DNA-binding beta-propeller fold protein YncE